jgi:hypothetical protein
MELVQNLKSGSPFKAAVWWVDHNGQKYPEDPQCVFIENSFIQYLGHVKLELQPHLVEVTWDTVEVSSKAMEAAVNYFFEIKTDVKIRLNYFLYGWVHEVYWDAFSATERIKEIQVCKSVSILHETQIRDCPISDIRYASKRVQQGYEFWKKSKGCFEDLDQSDLSQCLPNVIIYRPAQKDENLVFSWIGTNSTAAQVYGEEWARKSIGKPANNSGDVESQSYADKVSAGYTKTLNTGKPLYQHFRALMRLEGQDPFWVSFERLVTRYEFRSGSPLIISDVYPTQYVNIPFAGCP